jgi:hypothetical protein
VLKILENKNYSIMTGNKSVVGGGRGKQVVSMEGLR